jgi:ABC-type sulfate transport system permease component
MPLAIYQALETDLSASVAIAAILILISFFFLMVLRLITHGRIGHPMM